MKISPLRESADRQWIGCGSVPFATWGPRRREPSVHCSGLPHARLNLSPVMTICLHSIQDDPSSRIFEFARESTTMRRAAPALEVLRDRPRGHPVRARRSSGTRGLSLLIVPDTSMTHTAVGALTAEPG